MLLKEIKILNENVQLPEPIVAFIHEFCQPYLRAVGNNLTHFMYRGITNKRLNLLQNSAPNDPILKQFSRFPELHNVATTQGFYKDRRPKVMNSGAHDRVNLLFTSKFGAPMRNGLATTGNIYHAESFGHTCIYIPIGEFKFCWAPKIRDLGLRPDYLQDLLGWDYDEFDYFDHKGNMTIVCREFAKRLAKQYKDTDLNAAIDSGHEISIYCDRCLVILPD